MLVLYSMSHVRLTSKIRSQCCIRHQQKPCKNQQKPTNTRKMLNPCVKHNMYNDIVSSLVLIEKKKCDECYLVMEFLYYTPWKISAVFQVRIACGSCLYPREILASGCFLFFSSFLHFTVQLLSCFIPGVKIPS